MFKLRVQRRVRIRKGVCVEGYSRQKEKERKKVKSLSRVQLFATPWTVAYQAPHSMEFSRQEYWSELLFPSPRQKELYMQKPAYRHERKTMISRSWMWLKISLHIGWGETRCYQRSEPAWSLRMWLRSWTLSWAQRGPLMSTDHKWVLETSLWLPSGHWICSG